jgi:hypothetical protein
MTDLLTLFDINNFPTLRFYVPIIVTPDFINRFESAVIRDDCMPDGCHIWIKGKNQNGYGNIRNNGRKVIASRASYTIYNGPIPHGMVVCHSCDNPPCVNPAHLFLGSMSDNTKDSVNKKRHSYSKKTHCPQGHEYSGDNLYLYKTSRKCRICVNEAKKRFRNKFLQ